MELWYFPLMTSDIWKIIISTIIFCCWKGFFSQIIWCLLGDIILHIRVMKNPFLEHYHLNNNCYYRLWRNGLQVFVFPGYGRKSTTARSVSYEVSVCRQTFHCRDDIIHWRYRYMYTVAPRGMIYYSSTFMVLLIVTVIACTFDRWSPLEDSFETRILSDVIEIQAGAKI